MSDFTSMLLKLSDDLFFELIRNYLGPVQTPFNKHDLIARLEAFLRKPEMQDRIVELIDDSDAELLSVVWVFNEPTYDELFEAFMNQASLLDLHHHLLNLEDRLLLYRDGEHIRINPVLKTLLEERVLRPGRVFQARKIDGEAREEPWIGDTLLLSVYRFLVETPEIFRTDGSLRKRVSDRLKAQIPPLTAGPGKGTPRRYELLFRALRMLGLVVEEGPALIVQPAVWDAIAPISPDARRALICGAAAAEDPSDCRLYGAAVETALRALGASSAIHSGSVERLLSAVAPAGMDDRVGVLRTAMEQFGLLLCGEDGYLVPAAATPEEPVDTPLVVHANFELTLQHEVRFSDGLFVARVAQLIRHDRYPRFELTKESYATAMRAGYTAEEVDQTLKRLAGGTIPPNVAVSLATWAHEYESLRLFRGVVLRVDESRRHMVDHSEQIQALIRMELAPGVYLLDESNVAQLQSELRTGGVEMVPELPDAASPEHRDIPGDPVRAANDSRVGHIAALLERMDNDQPHERPSVSAFLDELMKKLNGKRLTAEQQDELTTRIKRRVILTASQLRPGALRAEKTEAKGLDYAGKVRIIEQAVRSGSAYLEVIERTNDGSPERRMVEPSEIKREGGELFLIGKQLPDRKIVELPVSKLRLVRKLRRTLFSE